MPNMLRPVSLYVSVSVMVFCECVSQDFYGHKSVNHYPYVVGIYTCTTLLFSTMPGFVKQHEL